MKGCLTMLMAILRGIAELLIYVIFIPIRILALIFIGVCLLCAWIKCGKDTMIGCYQHVKEKAINTLKDEWNWVKTGEV